MLWDLPEESEAGSSLLHELMLGIFISDDLEGELEASLDKLKRDLPLIGDEIDPEELGMASQE